MRIRAEHLLAASEGHYQRFEMHGPRPIEKILYEAGVVDIEDFRALMQAAADHRQPVGVSPRSAYVAGAIDFFVIGLRAAELALK